MVEYNRFKRLSADTNVIIGLALLSEKGKKGFIDANIAGGGSKFAAAQYAEDLKMLEKFIRSNSVQLVLTPQVLYELEYRKRGTGEKGKTKGITPQVQISQELKDIALRYLEDMPQIKIARVYPHRQAAFDKFTQRLADEYVMHHIFDKNKNNNAPSDAIIMAQSSMIGMDFVTRDAHFTTKKHVMSDYSKAEKIYLTNQSFGLDAKVIAFPELEPTMTTRFGASQQAKKRFKTDKSFAKCAFYSLKEYREDRALEESDPEAYAEKYAEKQPIVYIEDSHKPISPTL